MKDGKEDIIGPEVDTKGTIALDHHSEHVTKSSVSQQRALEGLP